MDPVAAAGARGRRRGQPGLARPGHHAGLGRGPARRAARPRPRARRRGACATVARPLDADEEELFRRGGHPARPRTCCWTPTPRVSPAAAAVRGRCVSSRRSAGAAPAPPGSHVRRRSPGSRPRDRRAVGEVRRRPKERHGAGRPDHLGPFVDPRAVAVDDGDRRVVDADPRTHEGQPTARSPSVPGRPGWSFWNEGEPRPHVRAPARPRPQRQNTRASPPRAVAATRAPKGRQVCGSARRHDQIRHAWMSVSRIAAGTDSVEVVHQLLGTCTRNHRPDCHPALSMKRGDRRTLDSRRQRDRSIDRRRRDVVVHHQVGASHQHPVEPAREHLKSVRLGTVGTGDQDRLGLQDHFADDLQARPASRCCRSRPRRRSHRPPRAGCWSRLPRRAGRLRRRCRARRGSRRTTPEYDVAIRLPFRSASESQDAPAGRRSGTLTCRSRAASASSALAAGVEQQVAAGDAEVQGALADVERRCRGGAGRRTPRRCRCRAG